MKIFKSQLLRSTLIYTFSDILNKAMPFFLLPILTRYLTPGDYGVVATFTAFVGVVAVLTGMNVHGAVNVNFFKLSKEQLRIYVANVLIILLLSSLVLLMVVLLFHTTLSAWLNIPGPWLSVGVLIATMQFVTTINMVLWQAEKRAVAFGAYQLLQMMMNLGLTLLFVVGWLLQWEGRLLAIAIATVLFGFVSFGLLYKRGYLQFRYRRTDMEDALKFGAPLIPHSLGGWLTTGADKVLITTMISVSATGQYSVGFQVGMLIAVAAIAFNKAYSPWLFERLSTMTKVQKHNLVKMTYLYFVFMLVAALLLSVSAPVLVGFFLGPSFKEASVYIPWIAFGFAFKAMYLMVVNYIFFTKKTNRLGLITFMVSLLQLALGYWMIRMEGAIGAAQAMLISHFILFCSVWALSAKLHPMPWNILKGKK